MSERLQLPGVTLCAATSVNLDATLAALVRCIAVANFGAVILFTDCEVAVPSAIRRVVIPPLRSSEDYSLFMLTRLAGHIATSHALVVQWDGFITDAAAWREEFLDFDYIGAPWPQFDDGFDVGNGGFSLRSKRLLETCRTAGFVAHCPEDVAICRTNRALLEADGIRFADAASAARFAFERIAPDGPTFGFHGAFNLMPVIGPDAFWETYRSLDHRGSLFTDFGLLLRQLGQGSNAFSRRGQLTIDRLAAMLD